MTNSRIETKEEWCKRINAHLADIEFGIEEEMLELEFAYGNGEYFERDEE